MRFRVEAPEVAEAPAVPDERVGVVRIGLPARVRLEQLALEVVALARSNGRGIEHLAQQAAGLRAGR